MSSSDNFKGTLITVIIVLISFTYFYFYSYIVFHSFIELFTGLIGISIFIIAWNSRDFTKTRFFVMIGIGFLFIGINDIIHSLLFKGIGILPAEEEYQISLLLWELTRYMEAFIFLTAVILLSKDEFLHLPKQKFTNFVLLLNTAIYVTVLVTIFTFKDFPLAYRDETGFTFFKIYSEYILIGIAIISMYLLTRQVKRQKISTNMYQLLLAYFILNICTELAFTFNTTDRGILDFFGHMFKVLSYILIYKIIVTFNLRNPYRVLFNDLISEQTKVNQRNTELITISHDLLNYLYKLEGFLELSENSEYSVKISAVIKNMMGILEHSEEISKNGKSNLEMNVVNLKDLVEEVAGLILPSNVSFKSSKLPTVKGNKIKLIQVFTNLFENAIIHGEATSISVYVKENNIFLENNGKPIPTDIRHNIFEEGFSSKDARKGQGLAIVRNIVTEHNWSIKLVENGQQTMFCITLNSE